MTKGHQRYSDSFNNIGQDRKGDEEGWPTNKTCERHP